ncbi:F-box protein [Endozoicomonas sp. ALE010]|uniref:F-box protein n=1 Tax=Endozoicomonas sp. ALE010 TaxID=3403081 RepID=UPI003BB7048F
MIVPIGSCPETSRPLACPLRHETNDHAGNHWPRQEWYKPVSNPLYATAAGLSKVPDCPVNPPAKTIRSKSPPTVACPEVCPQTQPLWQRTITKLPPELLVMIFDYLEFDDIRHVNATCLAFRDVVIEYKYIQELSYFARLPLSFREQYQPTARWQKKSLPFHPFDHSAPLNARRIWFRDRVINNLPQMSALLCLTTLGKMEPCPAYRMVPRFKVTLTTSEAVQQDSDDPDPVRFSPSSRHLLFYGRCFNDARILAKDDRGQWAQQPLNWSDNRGSRVITAANFSACTNRLLTCSSAGYINTLHPAHRCWEEVGEEIMLSDQVVQFSPSGNYMATYSRSNPLRIWRMEGNNQWQEMEVCGFCPGVSIVEILFSPSEQHLLPKGLYELTILSLNDRGAWSAQIILETSCTCIEYMDYSRFSPVADQLLVGYYSTLPKTGRVSIFSPEPSGEWQETIISPDFKLLEFSSTGKYLFKKYPCGPNLQLWPRPEKLSDWWLNPPLLPHPDAPSTAMHDSVIVLKHESRLDKAQFSPSDSHLLVSCKTGTIYIWGKNQAGEWSIQAINRDCNPTAKPCFSLSGLHVLTSNLTMVGILGRSQQKDWPLKGIIRQDDILKAYFNPLSEHEVMVLSRHTDGDITNITLQIWETRDADKQD